MVENEGCRMAFSPSEAPVYGGSTIVAAFAEDSPLPEGCDFFLIFRGSQQRHITIARQLNAFTLEAIIPDHDCAELVEVSICAGDIAHHQIIASSLFQYIHDKTWDMARYLAESVTNHESLDSPNAPQFDLVGEDMDMFDTRVTSAFESLNLQPWWNVLGTTAVEEDPQPRETLLHFAARLGLRRLAAFLVEKPGAEAAIRLANKDGDLPSDLAKKTGHDEVAALLTDPDSYLSTSPVPRVWETREVLQDSPGKGETAVLKRHSLGSATLSTHLSTEAEARTLDDDISVLKHLDMLIGQKSPVPEPELQSPRTSVKEDQDSSEDLEAAETGDEHSEHDFLEESASDTDPFAEVPAPVPDEPGKVANIPTISVTQPTPERDGEGHTKILDENLRRLHNINKGIQKLREMNKRQFIVEEVRKENLSRLSCSCPDLAEGAASKQIPLSKDASRSTSDSSMFPVKERTEESSEVGTENLPPMFPLVGSQEVLADLRIEEERDREILGRVEEDGKMNIEGVTEDSTNVDDMSADKDWEEDYDDIETIQLDAVVMPTSQLEDGDQEEEKREEGEQEEGTEIVPASRPSQSPRRHSWGPISPIQMSEEDKMATMLKSHSMNHLEHENDSEEEFHDAKEVISPNLPITVYDTARTPSPQTPSPQVEEMVDPTATSPDSDISGSGTLLSETPTETGSLTGSSISMEAASPQHQSSPHHVKSSSAGSLGDMGIDIKDTIMELDEDDLSKKRSMSMSPVQMEKDMLSSPGLTKAVSTSALQQPYIDNQTEFKKPAVPPVMHQRPKQPLTRPSNFESDEELSRGGKAVPGGVAALKAEDKEKSVRRRFSFIFSSTRLKSKSKGKDKESASTHQFVHISFSNSTVCDICAKTLANKPALQCQNCSINVHESNCQSSVPPCPKAGKSKKSLPSKPSNTGLPPPYPYSGGRERPRSEIITGNRKYGHHSLPPGMVREYNKHGSTMSSKPPFQTPINSKPISEEDQDSDMAGSRLGRPSSHGGSITNIHATISASLESLDEGAAGVDDLQEDSDILLMGMEPETWRETIDNKTLKKLKLSERDVKRQNAIYELMRTEMQHFKTLKIMQRIFAHGMLYELRMEPSVVDQIFPALDDIIDLHSTFKQNLQDRRKEQSPVVEKIGDIICQQFQDELGERMTVAYGELCSKQAEAISLYREWYTRDRKFQNFIKKCSQIPLCRRFGVPEHIRLVSQRITQYPLLLDAILKRTKESKPDHEPLKQARQLVVDLLNRVDEMVDDYNRQQKLLDIYNKLEKGHATFKNGRKFRRDDLLHNHRKLIHEGVVGWKNARGTVKEVTAVVLSDMLLFLHENNQRYSFYSQDQKSAVIPLFKLLVREVANEERSLFLISANTVEMYEIMCVDGKERESLMKIIREAVNNCPEEEDEGMKSETEEERKITEARAAKMNQLIEEMTNRDREVNHHLQEKMRVFAELTELIGREDVAQQIKPSYTLAADTGEVLQAKKWLQAAIQEAENLKNTLYGPGGHLSRSVSSVGEHGSHLSPVLPKRNKTFGGFDANAKEESGNGARGSFKKRYPASNLNDVEQSSSSPDLPSRVGGASGDRHQLSHSKSDSVTPTEQEHRTFKLSLALLQAFSLIPMRPILSLPPKVGLDRRGSGGSRRVHMEDGQHTPSEHSSQGDISGRGSPPPYSLVPPSSDHISSVTNLIDYLCRLQSTISQQDTALERYRVQLLEANERISKYQQVQEKESKRSVERQLEELRQLQDQLNRERHQWEKQKKRKERELQKEIDSLDQEKSDFQQERESFRLNAHDTRDMGNSGLQGSQGQYRSVSSASYGDEDIWIVRTTGEGSDNEGSSSAFTSPVSDSGLSNETPPGTLERHGSTASLNRKTSSKHIHEVPPHLMSATNQEAIRQRPKSPPFKQQLPLKLASNSNLQQVGNNNVREGGRNASPGLQQMIPKKLTNSGSGSSLHSGGSGSSLHSNDRFSTGNSSQQTSPPRGSQRNSPPGSSQRHSPPQPQQVIPGKLVSSTTMVAHSRTHSLPSYSHYDQQSPPANNNNEEPPPTPTSPEQKVIYF